MNFALVFFFNYKNNIPAVAMGIPQHHRGGHGQKKGEF